MAAVVDAQVVRCVREDGDLVQRGLPRARAVHCGGYAAVPGGRTRTGSSSHVGGLPGSAKPSTPTATAMTMLTAIPVRSTANPPSTAQTVVGDPGSDLLDEAEMLGGGAELVSLFQRRAHQVEDLLGSPSGCLRAGGQADPRAAARIHRTARLVLLGRSRRLPGKLVPEVRCPTRTMRGFGDVLVPGWQVGVVYPGA